MAVSSKPVLIPFRHHEKVKPYEIAARAAGLEPVSVLTSGRVSLDGVAGLLLMGGSDVNPKLYGAPAHPLTEEPDDERDTFELEAIHAALERDLPIFAICRGLQLLNVYHRGTLIQHLPSTERHEVRGIDPGQPVHQVVVEPESRLAEIAGSHSLQVNSRHHQAADRIGAPLRISARDATDKVVEALEQPDKRFVVAVQWHPEDQAMRSTEQFKLFQAFANACC